ncbi:MAG TPA: hypothetical protein PLT82_10060 [Candidatus Hydrogenedens sp.]|nr:hypothetical protein [Candidatus Hydrogenedens sp.]HPP59466.1 hypothetical protein [Candidatus Hydrogenedens sp.]
MRHALFKEILPIILLIPFFIFFISVNVLIDPAGLLRKSQEKQIAQWLNEGYGVINAINVDYRKIIKERILLMQGKPDIIIMGSSRAMIIDSSFFPNKHILNCSLPSANLEDIIANYQVLYEAKQLPEKLILCPDLHYFNAYAKSNFHLFQEFDNAMERMEIVQNTTLKDLIVKWIDPRYFQILSPGYFQESIRFLPAWVVGKIPRPKPIEHYETEEKVIRPDGSIIYESSRRQRTQQEIELKAERYAFKHPEGLINYRILDPTRKQIFENFLKIVKKDGVEIEVIFIPIHPRSYEILSQNKIYKIIIDVEKYMRKVFSSFDIPVYGSFDATKCGCNSTDFYDAVHAKPEAIKRILSLYQ